MLNQRIKDCICIGIVFYLIALKLTYLNVWLFRSFKICTNVANFHKELSDLKRKFALLGYPDNILNDLIEKCKVCFNRSVELFYGPSKKLIYAKFPYVGISNIIVRKELLSLCKRYRPHIELRIVNYGCFRIRNLFPTKDRLTLEHISKVVYCLRCNDCGQQYYGSTNRHLHARVREHRLALQGRGHSSVADHILTSGHNVCFDKPTVLNRDNCEKRLRVKESLYIRNNTNLINNMQSSAELHIFT
jgi:hypothetical protein